MWNTAFQKAVAEALPAGTTASTPPVSSVTQTGTSTNPPPTSEQGTSFMRSITASHLRVAFPDNLIPLCSHLLPLAANGLGAGAISGIVIGSVAFVAIVGVAFNEVIKKRNRAAAFNSESDGSDEFAGYDVERNTTRR
jgi:hypothetical protein